MATAVKCVKVFYEQGLLILDFAFDESFAAVIERHKESRHEDSNEYRVFFGDDYRDFQNIWGPLVRNSVKMVEIDESVFLQLKGWFSVLNTQQRTDYQKLWRLLKSIFPTYLNGRVQRKPSP